MMDPAIVELLFTAASNFTDETERATFLDHACRGDAALRKRLEKLLALETEGDTLFEFQPGLRQPEPNNVAAKAEPEEGTGAHIGRYRLITRIGAGGCGVVYYAEQEEPVRRKVALKIIKMGMDTEAVIARFEQERQALAQMDHTNIAHVLDAGATASGRPYFVMEVVDGEKVTDFCDSNRFTIRQRLELFIEICRGVQHAHQKGIIHRDIKPSNILVQWQDQENKVAVPKIIDFGIAKATSPGLASGATATRFDQFLGTPAYMSPEQAQGSGDVDTRSDIYSLGVLLYELLSGCTPFNFKQLSDIGLEEVRRIIREEEPKRPSAEFKMATPEQRGAIAVNRGTDASNLLSQLQGDLDWIVMKAIEKERSRRYETANGLVADILRYLNDDVVSARPPSRTYRLRKLVRRNKLVFAGVGIAAVGLLAGFGTSTVMYFKEKAARQEQARLRENADFLRRKAELRGLIAQAAVRIKYGDIAGADALLAKVPVEETPSSLEATDAFSAVADWHMHASRLKEAAARYAASAKAISSIDESDVPTVSLSVLPAAALVAYNGETQRYEEIRQLAAARFHSTTNPVVAEEILKACLLFPAGKEMLQSLIPLREVVERAIEMKQGLTGTDPLHNAWACFSLSLFYYRAGEYIKAVQWADRCLASSNKVDSRTADIGIIRAMIEQKLGRTAQARDLLTPARKAVKSAFEAKAALQPGPAHGEDWIAASVLLVEAERMVDDGK